MFLFRLFFCVVGGSLKIVMLSLFSIILLDYSSAAAVNIKERFDNVESQDLVEDAKVAFRFIEQKVKATDWKGLADSAQQFAQKL